VYQNVAITSKVAQQFHPCKSINVFCRLDTHARTVMSTVHTMFTLRYLNDRITELVCSETSRSSPCWSNSNRSPGQTFPGVLSDFHHRLSGTRCHTNSSDQQLCFNF